MTEDCEEGGTIRCCVDGFVVWVFDFFLLIICHLRAQLCLELLAIFKISSFYFMVYAKPYGLLAPRNQSRAMSAAGDAVEQIIQWKEKYYVGAYSIHCSSELLGFTPRTHTSNSCTLHGNMSDVLDGSLKLLFVSCIIYISTPSAILNFCRYCKLLRHCVCKFSHFTCRQWSESLSEFSLFPQQLWDWHGPHLRWRLGADCFLRICSFYKYNKTYDKL